MARMSKTERGDRYRSLLRGMKKHWKREPGFGDHPYTEAEIVTFLQRLVTAFDDTDRAWAAYKKALASRRKLERESAPLVKRLVEWTYVTCSDEQRVVDFDLPPLQPKGPRTVEAKQRMVRNRKKRKSG